ncbi:MAG TPA: ABC transporter ATP-binding protein [Salinivirgaceae bacterium]|nr:ABC transporter ATP-binding protein [Salinivirgaceae bacterium]
MLDIQSLSFHYQKGKSLFDNLNLEIETGKIYGLLGLNGAGKTTLLKLMGGTLLPKRGTILLEGMNVSLRSSEVLEQIYMIPEDFNLPSIKITQCVTANARFYPHFDQKYFKKLLDDFELSPSSTIQSLSYGQKKKFLIAFGIATNVPLLLLDEPTNGLDIPSKSQFRKAMVEAVSNRRTFLISTHQVRDLSSMMDQVVMIDQGKIIFNQPVSRISSVLGFGQIPNDTTEFLYSEESLVGRQGIFKNCDGESSVDFELLFNALLHNSTLINNCFKTEINENV